MDFGNFEASGSVILGISVLTILLILGIIFVMRNVFAKRSMSGLKEKYENNTARSPLEGRNKYPEMDVFSLSGTFFNIGLMAAIGMVILAFSWTQYDRKIDISQYNLELPDEIEMETPRTADRPPPPPPPPPAIEEVSDEEIIEDIPFESLDIKEEDDAPPPPVADDKPAPPPPPPPPPPKQVVDDIFRVVEEMPSFPGCESVDEKAERKKCADEKLLQFIYQNIKYPSIARENGVEGNAVISFIIEKDGSITDAKVVRDPGAQTGSEALRVVKMMPNWNPGKQRGRPVRVQFNLPVKFKLE